MLEILFYKTEQGRLPVIEYIDELDQNDKAQILADFELIKNMGLKTLRFQQESFKGGNLKGNCGNLKQEKEINIVSFIVSLWELNWLCCMPAKNKSKKDKKKIWIRR